MSKPAREARGPMRDGPKAMAKPSNLGDTVKRIARYMKDEKWLLVIVFFAIIISSLANIIGISALQIVIDDFLHPMLESGADKLTGDFLLVIGGVGIVYIVGVISTYAFNRIMVGVSTRTLYKIRVDLFRKMEKLPIKFYDTTTHGNLMSLYTNDIDTLRQVLSNTITGFLNSLITVVGVFTMMIIFSWQLTIIVVVMIYLMMLFVKFIGGKSASFFMQQQKELGRVNGYIEEMIEGQKVIKVFSRQEKVIEEFDALNEELRKNATKANVFANILMPIMINLSYVLYAFTAMAGGVLAIKGFLTIGTVIVFLQYTRTLSHPINQISQQMNSVLTALAGAERVFGVIDQKPEVDDGHITMVPVEINEQNEMKEVNYRTGEFAWKELKEDGTVHYTHVRGNVVFNGVTFGYEENKTVLKNISLYAKPGQKIAFVGSTGAGKTTITNLINRFYDVPSGNISIDGIEINKIKKADLRRSLSMVLQDTHLFTGTVMENIRYGRLDATDEEVIAAAKLANADTFIRHLENGYQTVLKADGSSLSQGQRQLLAIARAAIAETPILILDEATSSIDTRTEKLIQKGMDRLMEGKTSFIIAHRLSTVRSAKAIMVLEHGEIIERGDHDQLIEQKGRYYELSAGLFELT
ncbi:ABC transporter ATP-binding protein [Amphibacillus xylanus]|uniref:Putative ABC transporter permease/ATP-binding protein n=1 Tax=Amphibacillus xylanus (strain ATCC 51415 / DSM 6626 / JCM 7361 / LMG 17667 / NBRC 15112 / Ep01) TaxID=698758 RepID=K0IW81_AMPXN|nr:ABC transporter ATP-binding protein [Amphibacillus xylanus]BAM46710.1 putative ABC transporter permease/ATP-binding protein [Amphibacillus xylanus NBRC 15112]